MGFSNHVYSPHSLKNRQLAEKREPTMFYGYAPRLEELQGISSVRLLLRCEAEVVYEQEPSFLMKRPDNLIMCFSRPVIS